MNINGTYKDLKLHTVETLYIYIYILFYKRESFCFAYKICIVLPEFASYPTVQLGTHHLPSLDLVILIARHCR